MTNVLEAIAFLAVCFVLCWIGKLLYGLFHPGTAVDREVIARDNVAFAIPLGAYYLGIVIALGAPLSGQARGDVVGDVASLASWGLLAVLLLNVASAANRFLLFRGFDLDREILQRNNVAAGIILGGSHVANALLILGALAGEGGLVPAAVFWIYAQLLLALAARTFLATVRYDLAAEIRRSNRAVGCSLAGLLIAMGNLLRMAITGSFTGWSPAFTAATSYAVAGLVLLFVARSAADWLLLPGVTIHQEVVEQEVPNVGVGYLEALLYFGASLLVGWSL
jgi:uncharacterized membrane protein YjfL (UPF0719 family)